MHEEKTEVNIAASRSSQKFRSEGADCIHSTLIKNLRSYVNIHFRIWVLILLHLGHLRSLQKKNPGVSLSTDHILNMLIHILYSMHPVAYSSLKDMI
jgi:hypothetical protein